MKLFYLTTLLTLASTQNLQFSENATSVTTQPESDESGAGQLAVGDLVSRILAESLGQSNTSSDDTTHTVSYVPTNVQPGVRIETRNAPRGHEEKTPGQGMIHQQEYFPHPVSRVEHEIEHHPHERSDPLAGKPPHPEHSHTSPSAPTRHISNPVTGPHPGSHQQLPNIPTGQPPNPITGIHPGHYQQLPTSLTGQPHHSERGYQPRHHQQLPTAPGGPHMNTVLSPHTGYHQELPTHPTGYPTNHVSGPHPGYVPQQSNPPTGYPPYTVTGLQSGYQPQQPSFHSAQLPHSTAGHQPGYPSQHPSQINPFDQPYNLKSQVIQNLELLVTKCLKRLPECPPEKLHLPTLCNVVLDSLGMKTCIVKDPMEDMNILQKTVHLMKEGIIATKDYVVEGAQTIYRYFH